MTEEIVLLARLGPWGLGHVVFVEKADVHPVCLPTFLSLVMAMWSSSPCPNGH